jgi:hypothetical protein
VYRHAVSLWRVGETIRSDHSFSLAMAEMTTLATAIYRKYSTSLKPSFQDVSPGATSRFEVLHDDKYNVVEVGGAA